MTDSRNSSRRRRGGAVRKATAAGAGALLALIVWGCSELLDVEAPTQVPEERLNDPQNAELLVSSAIADFDCAFVNYIAAGGLMGDELVDSQLAARMWDYDRRTISKAGPSHEWTCGFPDPGVYQSLSTARFSADNAIRLLEGFDPAAVPDHQTLLATVYAYSGYARLLLGEAHCSAGSLMPVEGGLAPGPEITSDGLFQRAIERFQQAISIGQSAGADEIVNMARVGTARANLNLGNDSQAAQLAGAVPQGFVRDANFSSQTFRSSNQIWTLNNRDQRVTVEDDFRDLAFGGVADPRVPVRDENALAAADNFSPWFTQQKYPEQEATIPIARYEEARLILAEASLGQAAVDIINELHAAAGLPAWTPANASDDVEVLGHVYEERRRELFLESQHFFDKIRLAEKAQGLGVTPAELNASLPVDPAAGEPFPQKGGDYGVLQCLPLPEVEELNNPDL